jgi:hypothetical protein
MNTWTEKQRKILDTIMDEIIPPSDNGKIPGAGALGVADFLPAARPYATDPIKSALTLINFVGEDFIKLPRPARVAILKKSELEHAEAFATLIRVTYMGYYSRSDIRPHFGVGSHPIHPQGYTVLPESHELMNELTAPVRQRGKVYRNAE